MNSTSQAGESPRGLRVKELIAKNRSYRGYNHERRVAREELLELVDCARLCASSVNQQPLKFYLAWEEDEVAAIQAQTAWAKGLPELTLPHPGMEPPAFVVICQDLDVSPNLKRFTRDVGIAAQSMLLAATEMGLGGCMIGSFAAAGVSRACGLGENLVPLLVVAIGEPAEKVVLDEAAPGDSVAYWRDADDTHHVPKRTLDEVALWRNK